VEDYAPFRAADGKPWYHLLGILQESRSEELRQNSRGEVAFVQLYEQPDSYRGELVTLSGMAKRATQQSAAPNSQGIEGYYELVLQPLDGPLRPISIKVLELPEGFPVGEGIREDVELTGFFFKNLVYLAEDGNDYIMPVLLAKDVQWEPQQSQAERRWNPSAVVAWGMVGGLAILATLLSLLVYVVSNRIALPGRNSAREPIPGNFDALHREQVKTVEEKLDEMAGKDELPRNETQ